MRPCIQILLLSSILFNSHASGVYTAEQWKDDAMEYYSSGSYERALNAIDQSIVIDESDSDALVFKAMILEHLNRYDDAIDVFDKVLTIDENNEVAWAGKGDVQYMIGDYEKAVYSYDRSIGLDRTSADVLYKKGLALKEMGRDEESDDSIKEALRINPSIAYRRPISDGIKELDLTPYSNKRNVLNRTQVTWDFETGNLIGWRKTGNAFDYQPTYGDNIAARNQGYTLQQGDYWIGTYEMYPGHSEDFHPGNTQGYAPTGKLVSSPFMINGNKIDFLVGGGSECTVDLVVNDSVELATNGGNRAVLSRIEWNVTPFRGRIAHIEVNDNSSDLWGYICFDDVRFDVPPLIMKDRIAIPSDEPLSRTSLLVIKPL